MKYFTKEELEDIANELLNSPNYDTLRKLYEKYNNTVKEDKVINSDPIKEPQNIWKESITPNPSPVANINIPNIEPSNINNQPLNNPQIVEESSSFSLPKLENPTINSYQNNEPISFDGNLFAPIPEEPNPSNMMQPTDNFISANTQIPVNNSAFFKANPNVSNNPIPITENTSTYQETPYQGPTMFGQLQNDYRNAA